MQSPVQTVQLHVSRADLAVGTAIVSFAQFFGGAFMLAIAQTLFGNLLRHALVKYAPGVDPSIIKTTGATDILRDIPAAEVVGVKMAYNSAIAHTLMLAAGLSAVGTLCAFGMGWKKVPKKTKKSVKDDQGRMQKEVVAKADV